MKPLDPLTTNVKQTFAAISSKASMRETSKKNKN